MLLTIFSLGKSHKWGSLRPRRSSSSNALAKPGCALVRKGQSTQATESGLHRDPQVLGSPGSFLLRPGGLVLFTPPVPLPGRLRRAVGAQSLCAEYPEWTAECQLLRHHHHPHHQNGSSSSNSTAQGPLAAHAPHTVLLWLPYSSSRPHEVGSVVSHSPGDSSGQQDLTDLSHVHRGAAAQGQSPCYPTHPGVSAVPGMVS